jgi:hypothetical protein
LRFPRSELFPENKVKELTPPKILLNTFLEAFFSNIIKTSERLSIAVFPAIVIQKCDNKIDLNAKISHTKQETDL